MNSQTDQLLVKYYRCRDESLYTKYTKEEVRKMVDPYNESTFLWLLEELNYPYIKSEWNRIRDYYDGSNIFGRYLSKMRLMSFKGFTWADTQWLNKD